MRIDIWSDVVCPWCSIGKRRLEQALADFPHRDQVEVVYHSFMLDPGAPTEPTGTAQEMLARKYGLTLADAAEKQSAVIAVAAELGMDWHQHHDSPHVGTFDAHRLLHLALAEGGPVQQATLKDALLQAYFGEARNVADHDVLREVAAGVGLDAARVDEVLASDAYAADVAADIAKARAYGATGVPFFVVDEKYGVSGAQPAELFAQLLERAWAESRPHLETVPAAADAEVCGPDGCAI
ncbi:DsbA family oxidoreductase [Nocardioides bizhenqiangii]|uniref:DsbA family oxidoreductase n=1 Tax=Nocardioides bizhenqiangii TaxID=3095076 RepID=A0ABZ0ZUP5_9ACTN|nr:MULTISPECIES: DsbA family oxidoreductase [unclassified Nocardioides]MDZ5622974.1 DsbA family oxidoreductase [Nocardioides sp. HM23]WQQ27957.1 DsbA family oxidoreductase [Nocardioides sp. HM61]